MIEGRARTAALFVGSIVVAFALWQFLSTVVFNPFLIPPPLVGKYSNDGVDCASCFATRR